METWDAGVWLSGNDEGRRSNLRNEKERKKPGTRTGRNGTGRDGTGRDGTGRDGTGRDGGWRGRVEAAGATQEKCLLWQLITNVTGGPAKATAGVVQDEPGQIQ